MDTYSIPRTFADSWALLALFGFFIAAAIWAFLPSQRRARLDAAEIVMRDMSDAPLPRPAKKEQDHG